MKKFVFLDKTPNLQIIHNGGTGLGNCYYCYVYKIISKTELTDNQIKTLRSAGFLGYGQEFFIRNRNVIEYDVPCVVFLDGVERPDIEPVNPWSGQRYPSIVSKKYEYIVEDMVDSSG